MPSLHTEIEIDAPKHQVWRVLFHKEHWVKWNSFLFDRNSAIPFQAGQVVMLSLLRSIDEEEIEFHPSIAIVQPGICLGWISTLPGFQTESMFELEEIGLGRTKYIHRETFSGWLVALFLPSIREDEQRGMDRMARELKRYVERKQLEIKS